MSRTREYRFNGDRSDSLGNGADAALLYGPNTPGPGPTFVDARNGQGADFTPGQGYLSFDIPSGTKAVSMWARKDSALTFRILLSTAGNNSAIWYGFNTSQETRIRLFNSSELVFTTDTFAINTWHRVMWANDGTDSHLLVDAELIGSAADAIGIPAGTYAIGGQDSAEQREFPGIIDELYLYNNSLSNSADAIALAQSDLAYAKGASDHDQAIDNAVRNSIQSAIRSAF